MPSTALMFTRLDLLSTSCCYTNVAGMLWKCYVLVWPQLLFCMSFHHLPSAASPGLSDHLPWRNERHYYKYCFGNRPVLSFIVAYPSLLPREKASQKLKLTSESSHVHHFFEYESNSVLEMLMIHGSKKKWQKRLKTVVFLENIWNAILLLLCKSETDCALIKTCMGICEDTQKHLEVWFHASTHDFIQICSI